MTVVRSIGHQSPLFDNPTKESSMTFDCLLSFIILRNTVVVLDVTKAASTLARCVAQCDYSFCWGIDRRGRGRPKFQSCKKVLGLTRGSLVKAHEYILLVSGERGTSAIYSNARRQEKYGYRRGNNVFVYLIRIPRPTRVFATRAKPKTNENRRRRRRRSRKRSRINAFSSREMALSVTAETMNERRLGN